MLVNLQPAYKPARLGALLLCSLLLGACQSEFASDTENAPNLSLSPPNKVVQVRAVDLNQVRPVVRLNENTFIVMQSNGDSQWNGTIQVQANAQYNVEVEWIETIGNRELPLAQWSDSVFVQDTGLTLNINTQNYNYNLDTDGDSVSNLDERQNNTDPFNAPSDSGSDNQTTDNNTSDNNANSNSNNTDTSADNSAGNTENNGTNGSSNNVLLAPSQVIIPRIANNSAPVIDGIGAELNNAGILVNEWANATQTDGNGNALTLSNLMIDVEADSDNGSALRSWAAMHDGEYLYVLLLSDDVGARKSDSQQSWNDDSVELFIDGDNSKLPTWGDADDYHVLMPLLKLNSSDANNHTDGRFAYGPGSPTTGIEFEFATGPGVGPDGIRVKKWEQDVYEIRIKLSSIGVVPGVPFGFELQLNDDDNGGPRDSKWGWFHPARNGQDTDTSYLNPSVMGTIELAP